jgi:hypothetical protein
MSPERLERTIDFILQSQGRAEARQDKLDRRVDSIAKLLKQGMRLFVKMEAGNADARARQKKMDKMVSEMAAQQKTFRADVGRALAQLAQAQAVTEQRLQTFMDSMRDSRNGH